MKRNAKEVSIGVAFVISIALVYIGVNFLKGCNVFSHDNTYYTVVPHAGGVATSSVITTNGYPIGTVSRVDYDYSHPNRIVIALRINESLRIPKGSRALLVNSLLGGVSVNLELSPMTEYYEDGDTLVGGVDSGMTEQIENMLLPNINVLMPKIDSLITNLTAFVANPNLVHSLHNIESVSRKLDYTADELNRVFYRELPLLMSSLQGTAANINMITSDLATIDYMQTISRVDSIIANIYSLSAALISNHSSIGRLVNDTVLYNNLNSVCANADALIEDIKAHPTRYINISVFGKK